MSTQLASIKEAGNWASNFLKRDISESNISYLVQYAKVKKHNGGNSVFVNLREKDTTKHVHRLHPYKGKFIPQLVQYFIDDHTDNFKKDVYFKTGDIILDPFSGSGTTLVQAMEMGMH